MPESRVLHVSPWDRSLPLPPPPRADITAGLWWCEGEYPEDGEFWLVEAPGEAAAIETARADHLRQTGELPDPASMSAGVALPHLVIAWWRRVQYPALEPDPEAMDEDCDETRDCANCGRPGRRWYDGDPCCLWSEAWAAADCDGDAEPVGVPLRPVTP